MYKTVREKIKNVGCFFRDIIMVEITLYFIILRKLCNFSNFTETLHRLNACHRYRRRRPCRHINYACIRWSIEHRVKTLFREC